MVAMRRTLNGGWWTAASAAAAAVAMIVVTSAAQTPQPFPRAGQPPQAPRPPSAPAPQPVAPAPASAPAPPAAPPAAAPLAPDTPSAATLGFPVYPGAQFIASYDAGRGQRYYLFGTTAVYADTVLFYRNQLGERGDVVFKEPPTHMFSIGRFREETMAFPPGVTVKDWTWGGSQGYPNPKLGGQPGRFPTIIMIVPAPAAATPVPAR
jgi:hypothetical protein